MKIKSLLVSVILVLAVGIGSELIATGLMAEDKADGKWLHRVPQEDRVRVNPVVRQPQAEAAGKILFGQNCAKCHGADANGLKNRPSLRSPRVRNATDGELAWMLRNGNPYQGMPPWSSLPEVQRWQIIAYLRTLPPAQPVARPAVRRNPSGPLT